jgi:hypothetical protein
MQKKIIIFTCLFDSLRNESHSFFLMQNDKYVGVVHMFFDIEKKYNYESKSRYLHIIK